MLVKEVRTRSYPRYKERIYSNHVEAHESTYISGAAGHSGSCASHPVYFDAPNHQRSSGSPASRIHNHHRRSGDHR